MPYFRLLLGRVDVLEAFEESPRAFRRRGTFLGVVKVLVGDNCIMGAGHAERRMQVVFADDPLLSDPYWADWVIKLRQPVVTLERDGSLVRGHLVITVD